MGGQVGLKIMSTEYVVLRREVFLIVAAGCNFGD